MGERKICEEHQLDADFGAVDGGFFVFGDLSIKVEGEFRLKFTLFEMRKYALLQPTELLGGKN